MKVEGKGALVSGGANGIGKATAKLLLEKGAKVCIVDMNVDAGQSTLNEFREKHGECSAFFCQCDVTNADDLKRAFETTKELVGRLDIVFNNAGVCCEGKWEKIIDVNLTAVVRASKLALEMMRKDKGNEGGVVINTASIVGFIPYPILPVYSATKHAVVGLTRALAARNDALETQVRFNCICPELVKTNLTDPDCTTREDFGEYYDPWIEALKEFESFESPMSADHIAECLLELIENDIHQGSMMHISPKGREMVSLPQLKNLQIQL